MKKLIAVLVAALLLIPATVAFAAPKDPALKTNAQEIKTFILSQKEQIKASRQSNQSLREVIKAKHDQIKAKVQDLKQKKDESSKNILAGLKDKRDQVKATREGLKALNGKVKAEFALLKTNRKNKNIEGVRQNIQNIISIQQQRNQLLTKLDAELDEILAELQ